MCGLIGAAGTITDDVRNAFTELLLIDVVRGHHSTGVAAIKRFDNSFDVRKAPIASPIFIGTSLYQEWVQMTDTKVLIGHNRYATVGDKTVENAHPFEFPELVGAHNGTIDKWSLKKLPNYAKFDTDSQAIYANISDTSLKETLSHLTGAWALTWFDKKNNTINLIRNKERPLFYAYSEDRKTLFWSSESDMLEWITTRHNFKLYGDGVFSCEEDLHHRWTVPEFDEVFEKPVCSMVEGYKFESIVTKSSNSYGVTYHCDTGTLNSLPFKSQNTNKTDKIDTSKFRPPYKNAYNKVLSKSEFISLVNHGCVFCEDCSSEWGDFIFPLKDDLSGRSLYICEDCYNDDDVYELVKQSL
jgi:predicted glutamine amidotransferase